MTNKIVSEENIGTITLPADRGIPIVWDELNPRQLEQVRQIVREEIEKALREFAQQLDKR